MAMDEQPLQLLKETRQPISAARHHPKRIEYERAGESVSVLRTFGRLAAGDGPADEDRLGSRGRRPAAGALCEGRESDLGLRQLEHAHAGVLRSRRCGHGPIAGTGSGVLPHAEAWQLAERGRERVEFVDAAVCEKPMLRHGGRIASRDHCVADGHEPPSTGS